MIEEGTLLQGRYLVGKMLGRGGMGEVYLATHTRLGTLVAIKTLTFSGIFPVVDEPARRQFENEGRVLASLDHPNLARVTDFFEEDGIGYLVMEYVDGSTLSQVVESRGQIGELLALDWIVQMLHAVAYLHSRNPPVIVRDLKPSNTILRPDGRICLIDFGIAKQLVAGSQTNSVIRSASDGFAPIEQYGGGGSEARSDLYSVGATLLFLLTGKNPPDAVSRVSHGSVLPDPAKCNSTVSVRTTQAIERLMAISQSDRPVSAEEALRLLVVAPPTGPLPVDVSTLPARSEADVSIEMRTPVEQIKPELEVAGVANGRLNGGASLRGQSARLLETSQWSWIQGPIIRAVVVALVLAAVSLGLVGIATYTYGQALDKEGDRLTQEVQATKQRLDKARTVRLAQEARERQEQEARAAQDLQAQQARAYEKYCTAAQRVVEVLGRLDAATDVGINYRDFSASVRDLHYQVEEFKRLYGDGVESRYRSYRAISEAEDKLIDSVKYWRVQIYTDEDDVKAQAKARVSALWCEATVAIQQARRSLGERN